MVSVLGDILNNFSGLLEAPLYHTSLWPVAPQQSWSMQKIDVHILVSVRGLWRLATFSVVRTFVVSQKMAFICLSLPFLIVVTRFRSRSLGPCRKVIAVTLASRDAGLLNSFGLGVRWLNHTKRGIIGTELHLNAMCIPARLHVNVPFSFMFCIVML